MGKSELFSHFADRFEVKRTQAREFFDELTSSVREGAQALRRVRAPGMVKLVVQKRKARMGRNPATGEAIKIPAKTVVKARIAKQLKDAVLPEEVTGAVASRPRRDPPNPAPARRVCVFIRLIRRPACRRARLGEREAAG